MFLRPLILAAIVGLFAANASAAVLFSTLGQSSDEVFPPINSTDVWVATDFTTGGPRSYDQFNPHGIDQQ